LVSSLRIDEPAHPHRVQAEFETILKQAGTMTFAQISLQYISRA
jgi:hypothetical protein